MSNLFAHAGTACLGGAIIGAAASLLLLTHGRIAGISSIFGDVLQKDEGGPFRAFFIGGLLITGMLVQFVMPDVFDAVGPAPLGVILAAGVLVGFGTRRGGGCTSGHGVCGLSMLSARSLVATLVFMGVGMLTVFVTRHALHLPTGTP